MVNYRNRNAGLTWRDIGTKLGVNHTVVSRLVLKQHGLSGQVKEIPRSAGDAYERQVPVMIEHL